MAVAFWKSQLHSSTGYRRIVRMAGQYLSVVGTYRALMAGWLVAQDKCPGIQPLGIDETWQHLAANATLHSSGSDAKELCGIDQLCAGLEAGIEGGI
jgi:hypothetical protein